MIQPTVGFIVYGVHKDGLKDPMGQPFIDDAIVAQSMLLAAVERGLGGCMVGSIDHDALRRALEIPPRYEIPLVLALGRPAETIVLEHGTSPDAAPYWRDEQDVHHVPKRSTEEVLLRA